MQAESRVSAANFADPSEFPARKAPAIWRVVRESPPLANVLFRIAILRLILSLLYSCIARNNVLSLMYLFEVLADISFARD